MGTTKTDKILIVDDVELNFKLIEKILRKEPFTLLYVKNGKEAIDICLTQRIDLVLMDLKMPGMNGFEASTRIRQSKPNLPILLQTAYARDLAGDSVILSLVDAIISKPIIAKELISKIRWYLKVSNCVAC